MSRPSNQLSRMNHHVAALLGLLLCGVPTLLTAQTITLSGVVSDVESGDLLIGASVVLTSLDADSASRSQRGAATNLYGFFSIPGVEIGRYRLEVRSLGYASIVEEVTLQTSVRRDFTLEPEEIEGDVVTVVGQAPTTREIGRTEITTEEIVRMPALGGESDVLRALQLTPSVQPSSEISSGLNVRGGSADQSLILLDEVVIYNPSHIGGFLSAFNTSALQKVELITGAFPAKYGGRLSSVLNLTSREGTKEDFSGNGGVSLLSSQLTLEGPIDEDLTYMISGRRFYIDVLKNLFTDSTSDLPDYHFYDLNAKIGWQASSTDRFYLSGYTGRDVLKSPDGVEYNINWGNSAANLRWAKILADDLFSNFSLSYTGYDFESILAGQEGDDGANTFVASTEIQDVRLKGNLSWYATEDHIIQTGVESVWHTFTTSALGSGSNPLENQPGSSPDSSGAQVVKSIEVAGYVQDEWQATDRLAFNIGLRSLWFQQGDYFFLEPRGAATYRIGEKMFLKGSFALAHQPVHLVIRNDLALPTDTWFPATEKIAPGESWQGTFGLAGTLGDDLDYSVEGYYKDFKNLYEFHDSVNFASTTNFEDQLTKGEGRAYGAEVFVEKKLGDFTGWGSYTLSWTDRTFPDINNGKTFFPRFDRRHSIKFSLFYSLGESWDFGATWVFATGQAYTVPTGAYTLLPFDERDEESSSDFHRRLYEYGDRNGFRLPPYHRLDVNFTHAFTLLDLPFKASLNVYNLYNRQNVLSWFIRQDFETFEPAAKQLTLFPILPSFGLSFEF